MTARRSHGRHDSQQRRVLRHRDVIRRVVEAQIVTRDVSHPDDDQQRSSTRWNAAVRRHHRQRVRTNLQRSHSTENKRMLSYRVAQKVNANIFKITEKSMFTYLLLIALRLYTAKNHKPIGTFLKMRAVIQTFRGTVCV